MAEQHSNIQAMIDKLRAQHPSAHGHGWDFDGFRVWVDSDEPALIAELRTYFSDFNSLAADSLDAAAAGGELTRITAIQLPEPPDFGANRTMVIGEFKPSVKGPKEAYFDLADGRAVHKLRTGMWFLFTADAHLAIGPCTANPNQVINFINNRKIQWSLHRGALLGHAAAVCRHDGETPAALPRTLAIAGQSGMGKSTLSLHLMNDRRLDFLSNDRVMICPPRDDGTIELEGVPKHPRINPGTILHNRDLLRLLDADAKARYEALSSDALWELEDKYDGMIRTCFPDQRFVLRGALTGLILLNWSRDGGETVVQRIDPRERRELLLRLIKKPGVFYLSGPGQAARRDVNAYLDYLDGVPVIELAGGIDFARGKAAALELLELDEPAP